MILPTILVTFMVISKILSFYVAVEANIENGAASRALFKEAFKLRFSKTEQRYQIVQTTVILNLYFRGVARDLLALSDELRVKKFNINQNEAERFKSFLYQVAEGTIVIFEENDVAFLMKESKSYSFFNSLISGSQTYATRQTLRLAQMRKEVQVSGDDLILLRHSTDHFFLNQLLATITKEESGPNNFRFLYSTFAM